MTMTISQIKVQTIRENEATYFVRSPIDVKALWENEISKMVNFEPEKEMFFALMINARNRIVHYSLITMGLLDACLVHPREVFRPAIASAAHSIILAHNHPSGLTNPSMEDLTLTRQLIEAGKIIGIPVLDHLIFSSDPFNVNMTSLRETGSVTFLT